MNNLKDKKEYYNKLSIGFNGQSDFFDKVIIPFKKYISSVYTSPAASMGIASARFNPDIFPSQLLEFREKIKAQNIEFNLIYNFDGIANPEIINNLINTANFLKPDIITVNGTFLIDKLIELTNYKLNISIINDINSLNQLHQIFEKDPDKRIVSYNIGRRKTYDLDFIRSVREAFPDLRLKLMVNEGCIFECPDQNFHSCSLTISSGKSMEENIFYCSKFKPDQYWRFLTGQYIPPKFLSAYCDLVDEFKLATRGNNATLLTNNFAIKILTEYINEEDITIARAMQSSFGGSKFSRNFLSGMDMLNNSLYQKPYPQDFFSVRSNCKHNCYQCNYCKNIVENKL
ncbi:MAG TPA: hypothetical protein PLK35_01425 [Candidatus Moranbacteria bacterium]|nr:hypothetical protein [Candidatus Moranbacteria bacterium]